MSAPDEAGFEVSAVFTDGRFSVSHHVAGGAPDDAVFTHRSRAEVDAVVSRLNAGMRETVQAAEERLKRHGQFRVTITDTDRRPMATTDELRSALRAAVLRGAFPIASEGLVKVEPLGD